MHTSVILLYNFESAILFVALMKTEMAIQVNLRKLRVHGDVLGQILRIGIPAGMHHVCRPELWGGERRPLPSIFNTDPDVVATGQIRLEYIFFAYLFSFAQEMPSLTTIMQVYPLSLSITAAVILAVTLYVKPSKRYIQSGSYEK